MQKKTERRIQKTGGSSYTVTLPKQWITSQHLSGQNEIIFFAHDTGTLCIQPLKEKQVLTQYISLESRTPVEVDRELIAAYIAGAEQIILTSHSLTTEFRQIIRNSITKLSHFDIFESTSTRVVLKYAGNPSISAKDYVRKSGNLVTSMLIDTLQALELRDRSIALEVVERDADIDRINLLVSRQFNQFLTNLIPSNGDTSLTTLNYYKHVCIRLERIADHIVKICKTFLQLKTKDEFSLTKNEITLTKNLIRDLETCATMVTELNKSKAHDIINEYEAVTKNAYLTKRNLNHNSINILIQDSLERIRSYTANIAEETLDYCSISELVKK